jgi:hypothetical protein
MAPYYFLGGENLELKFSCCFFESCQWNNLSPIKEKRRFATMTTLYNFSNVFIGGEKDTRSLISSVLSLENKMWKTVGHLSTPVSRHCTVQAKEDTIYIIGGLTDSSSFSGETIIFDAVTGKSSTTAVRLNRGRQLHSCAMLNENHIIVVGGRDARGALKSVESFDTRTSTKWIERKNLELPHGISYAQLVSNPTGNFFFYITTYLI